MVAVKSSCLQAVSTSRFDVGSFKYKKKQKHLNDCKAGKKCFSQIRKNYAC